MPNRARTIDREYGAEQAVAPRPLVAHKGRGAVTNLQGRYEAHGREAFDDGWAEGEGHFSVVRHVPEVLVGMLGALGTLG